MKYSRVDHSTSNISLDIKEIIKNITHNYYIRYDSKTILKEENNTVDHFKYKHEKDGHLYPYLPYYCNEFEDFILTQIYIDSICLLCYYWYS